MHDFDLDAWRAALEARHKLSVNSGLVHRCKGIPGKSGCFKNAVAGNGRCLVCRMGFRKALIDALQREAHAEVEKLLIDVRDHEDIVCHNFDATAAWPVNQCVEWMLSGKNVLARMLYTTNYFTKVGFADGDLSLLFIKALSYLDKSGDTDAMTPLQKSQTMVRKCMVAMNGAVNLPGAFVALLLLTEKDHYSSHEFTFVTVPQFFRISTEDAANAPAGEGDSSPGDGPSNGGTTDTQADGRDQTTSVSSAANGDARIFSTHHDYMHRVYYDPASAGEVTDTTSELASACVVAFAEWFKRLAGRTSPYRLSPNHDHSATHQLSKYNTARVVCLSPPWKLPRIPVDFAERLEAACATALPSAEANEEDSDAESGAEERATSENADLASDEQKRWDRYVLFVLTFFVPWIETNRSKPHEIADWLRGTITFPESDPEAPLHRLRPVPIEPRALPRALRDAVFARVWTYWQKAQSEYDETTTEADRSDPRDFVWWPLFYLKNLTYINEGKDEQNVLSEERKKQGLEETPNCEAYGGAIELADPSELLGLETYCQKLSPADMAELDPANSESAQQARDAIETLQKTGTLLGTRPTPAPLDIAALAPDPFDSSTYTHTWQSSANPRVKVNDRESEILAKSWRTCLEKQETANKTNRGMSGACMKQIAVTMADREDTEEDAIHHTTWEQAMQLGNQNVLLKEGHSGYSLADTVRTGAPDKANGTDFGKPLNSKQACVVLRIIDRTMRRLRGENIDPLRGVVIGEPGVGKSVAITAVRRHFASWGLGHIIAVAAYTGKAACQVNGCTIHSIKGGVRVSMNASSTQALEAVWAGILLLFIDEFSMVSPSLLGELASKSSIATGATEPFGAISVVFCGDPYQFKVIAGVCLHHNCSSYLKLQERAATAHKLYEELSRTLEADEAAVAADSDHASDSDRLRTLEAVEIANTAAEANRAALVDTKRSKSDALRGLDASNARLSQFLQQNATTKKGRLDRHHLEGFRLWHEMFTTVYVLDEQVRCAEDEDWFRFQLRIRHCYNNEILTKQGFDPSTQSAVIEADHAALQKMVIGTPDRPADDDRWLRAMVITPRNETRMRLGEARLFDFARRTGQRPMVFMRVDTVLIGKKNRSVESCCPLFAKICALRNDKDWGMMFKLVLAFGARFYTTENKYTSLNYTNGSLGTLVCVVLHASEPDETAEELATQPYRTLRYAPRILLRMDDPKFAALPGLAPGILPIDPATKSHPVPIHPMLKGNFESAKGKKLATIGVKCFSLPVLQAAVIGNIVSQGSNYPDANTPGVISDQLLPANGMTDMQDIYIPLTRASCRARVAILRPFDRETLDRLVRHPGPKVQSTMVSQDLIRDMARLQNLAEIEMRNILADIKADPELSAAYAEASVASGFAAVAAAAAAAAAASAAAAAAAAASPPPGEEGQEE